MDPRVPGPLRTPEDRQLPCEVEAPGSLGVEGFRPSTFGDAGFRDDRSVGMAFERSSLSGFHGPCLGLEVSQARKVFSQPEVAVDLLAKGLAHTFQASFLLRIFDAGTLQGPTCGNDGVHAELNISKFT